MTDPVRDAFASWVATIPSASAIEREAMRLAWHAGWVAAARECDAACMDAEEKLWLRYKNGSTEDRGSDYAQGASDGAAQCAALCGRVRGKA